MKNKKLIPGELYTARFNSLNYNSKNPQVVPLNSKKIELMSSKKIFMILDNENIPIPTIGSSIKILCDGIQYWIADYNVFTIISKKE